MTGWLLIAAIELSGVVGTDLSARAFFDAHNVKVGDPMILTVDFLGEADFGALHPPKLASAVASADWRLDDASAKTDTLDDGRNVVGRRITYRVRPRREGVLTFPKLAFAYALAGAKRNGLRTVETRAMPVRVKGGRQVTVAEIGEDLTAMPMPAPLIASCPASVTGDEEFAWRRACAKPTAAAFAQFDFPEARLNEARCAILEGNWSRALSIYRLLEWRIGQTPEIERGMIAAWARKFDNPAAELPVWRQVGRPLLKYAWFGRLAWVLGSFLALVLAVWLLNRGIRAVAALGFALLLVLPLAGEDGLTTTVVTNANGSVTTTVRGRNFYSSSTVGGSMSSSSSPSPMPRLPQMSRMPSMESMMDDFFASPFGRRRRRSAEPLRIVSTAATDRPAPVVGENFRIVLSVEMPRWASFANGLSFALEERPGLKLTGKPFALDDRQSANPTNVIHRYAFPYRAMQPLKGPLGFTVSGQVPVGGGFGFFQQTQAYQQPGKVTNLTVRELPTEGRPADFTGIVAEQVTIGERLDLPQVETNDVLTVTYRLRSDGYIPRASLPSEVHYEWQRSVNDDAVEYRRYVVADGIPTTPEFSVSYFNPRRRQYQRAVSRPTSIRYRSSSDH